MRRSALNPILTREDIPDVPGVLHDVSSVFNPGAISTEDGVSLVLRVQTRGRETVWMRAASADGARFVVEPRVIEVEGLDQVGERVYHAYDARLTRIEDEVYAVFACDTDGACRLAVARTRDLEHFELVSYDTAKDARNGVLFPARIGGRYLRLERPNQQALPEGVTSGDRIHLAASDDLVLWQDAGPVMEGRLHYWDERIGSGPPPIRVAEGWLHVYHGIATHFAAANLYQAGVVILDADDPSRVLARSRENVLEPREPYEQIGQVPGVVFPTGWTVEGVYTDEVAEPQARVRLYYGAADTCVGLAETTVGDLVRACREET